MSFKRSVPRADRPTAVRRHVHPSPMDTTASSKLALVVGNMPADVAAQDILQLQRMVGNRAVQQLMREPDADEAQDSAEGDDLSAEAQLFEELLADMTDEEIDNAFEQLALEDAAESEGAETENAEPVTVSRKTVLQTKRIRSGSIQRGKQKKISPSIAGTKPDINLANRIEKNRSKLPRLVVRARWNKIKKKHAARGYRKYAAILHRNLLSDNTKVDENLVLVIRLHKLAKIGKTRDRHFEAIEQKSMKQSQTPQVRTELLGEVVAANRMGTYLKGNGKMLITYASGAGIDQLWLDTANDIYYVVEAKGPNAKTTVNRFAVRGVGKGGGTLKQMSKPWISNRLLLLRNNNKTIFDALLRNCGLKIDKSGQHLVRNNKIVPTHSLKGLVVTASWNSTTGNVSSGMTKPTNF